MSVKQRLRDYIKYKGINERTFCLSIGASTSFVNSMRVSIQPSKVESIAAHYPDLSTGWLLTGEGKMLKEDYKREEPAPIVVEETKEPYSTISRLVSMNEKLFEENRALKEELDSLKRALNVQGKSA